MLTSFKQFLINENKEIYFTFGRMNPPTLGHGKLLDKLSEMADKIPYRVYLSHSQDNKKNPLLYESKVKTLRKFFPKHARSVKVNESNNILEIASSLFDEGFRKINLVVGDDRLQEFDILLNKYNGVKSKHGHYVFESIEVISAGVRDPDSEKIEGMSSTKLREAAEFGNFITFSQGLPNHILNSDAKKLYNKVRVGLGLNEVKTFYNDVKLETVSDIREKYIQGDLFNVGDFVTVNKTGELAEIILLGANYIIIESNGVKSRKWLSDVNKINKKVK